MRKTILIFFSMVVFFILCSQAFADYTAFRKYPYLIHGGYKEDSSDHIMKLSMMILWHASQDKKAYISFGQKDASGNIIYEKEIQVQGQNCCEREGKGTGCTCDTPISGFLFKYPKDKLMPGSVTYYQVVLGNNPDSAGKTFKASFKAAPGDASKNLIFYGLGDTRAGSDHKADHFEGVVTQLLKDISENRDLRNTLCIHDGDFVLDGQNKEDNNGRDYWDIEFFNPVPQEGSNQDVVQFLGHVPVMGVAGNHEGIFIQDGNIQTDYKHFGRRFKAYFPYPFYKAGPNRFYYSFDYGPVHFIMVDTNNRNDGSTGQTKNDESGYNVQFASLSPTPLDASSQYQWLKDSIKTSTKPWNIVVLHNPLYTATGVRDRFKKDIKIRDGLHNLFANDPEIKGKVKLVIQGHDHYYARSEKDGITYLTLGTGGANSGGKAVCINGSEEGKCKPYQLPLPEYPEVKAAYDNNCGPPGKNLPCFHFARFEITDGSMNVTVKYASKDTSGNIESFSVVTTKLPSLKSDGVQGR